MMRASGALMSTVPPTTIRLFFALDATSQASPLMAIQQQLVRDIGHPESSSKPSPVSAENLHLTLLFLGNQPMSQNAHADPCTWTNPGKPSVADVKALYDASFYGKACC